MPLGRAPAFWWREPGLASTLLAPAAAIYGAVAGRRMAREGERVSCPAICVGNFTVGGAGKTPTALLIGKLLRQEGLRPAFLLRGHGGSLAGPVRVEPRRHGPAEVGDEALLLARAGPTFVARDRAAGARLAIAEGADAIVMDDGLQNPGLEKNFALAVFDGAAGLGNARVLPAGPLRARLSDQWPRANAILVIGPGSRGDDILAQSEARGLPAFRGRLVPEPAAARRFASRRLLAFAGIGRPAKFYATLAELGAEVVRTRDFPDHHAYRAPEIAALLDEAARDGLVPCTTEKDMVRIATLREAEPRIAGIATLPVTLALEDPERFRLLLRAALVRPPRASSAAAGRGG